MPNLFSSSPKGISAWDIGTNSIKILTIASESASTNLVKSIEVKNSLGFAVPMEGIQIEQMQSLVGSIIKEYGLPVRGIRLTLPESAVSTQVLELPNLSAAELSSSIAWQAEQYLPIPNEELVTEYQVLYKPDTESQLSNEKMRILLLGTRQKVIDNLVAVFRDNGAEPKVMETQTVSLLRHFGLTADDPNTLILNLGASSNVALAVSHGEPVFTLSYPDAGELMTKTIMNEFNLNQEQAEAYKIGYGLSDQSEGRIRQALLPIMETLINNLKTAMTFFANKTNNQAIQRIILVGGGAQLIGLVDYLQQSLSLEVSLVDNFAGYTGQLPTANQTAFAVALGLLKRSSK